MAAAPQYATLTFHGNSSGRNYSVDAYLSDVANAQVNFDAGSGATSTSLTFWKCPEDVTLIDFSINTGMTDTKSCLPVKDGGQIPSQRLRYANFLNTMAFRPVLTMRFPQGTNFGLIQSA